VKQNVDFTKYLNERVDEYKENYAPGKYTDATEMSVGTIRALLSDSESGGKNITPEYLLDYWKKEYEANKTKNGFGRQGHGKIRHYYEGKKPLDEIKKENGEAKYPGNGPVIRVAPIGFMGYELFKYSIANADATHPHNKARLGSFLVAKALELIVIRGKKVDKSKIFEYLLVKYRKLIKEHPEIVDEETEKLMEAVDLLGDYHAGLKDEDYVLLCGPQPIPGLGITGMPCDVMRTAVTAFYLIKYYTDPYDLLKSAVLIGGDTGSLATTCLGIVIAKDGLASFPEWIIDGLEDRSMLRELSVLYKDFVMNWQ